MLMLMLMLLVLVLLVRVLVLMELPFETGRQQLQGAKRLLAGAFA